MRILLVSSYLPYPLFSGGSVRLYNLLKRLAKKHSITLVCEIRPYQTQDDINALKTFCEEIITVPRKKQWSLQNILKTSVSYDPFLIIGHDSHEMRLVLTEQLAKKQFDLIHIETFYVAPNLPKTNIPVVLVEHNIEYTIYKRFMLKAPAPLRPLLSFDVKKLKRREEEIWQEADCLVAVSEQEKIVMEKYNNKIAVVPNGVDFSQFALKNFAERKKNKVTKLLFIGDFSYVQNIDAVTFILQEVAPILRKAIKNTQIQFWIKGRKIPESIKNISNNPDIMYDETNTLSTAEIFSQSDLLLAPIRIGAGTQYKILEGMAVGTPVVTTPLGNEGIDARPDKEILIAVNAEDMVIQIKKIIDDSVLYEAVAKAGRTFVEKRFDWELITKQLENVYQDAISKK